MQDDEIVGEGHVTGLNQHVELEVIAGGDLLKILTRLSQIGRQIDAEFLCRGLQIAFDKTATQHPVTLEKIGTLCGVMGASPGASSPRR